MGNNMVLGIMNINLTYDPNSKKISGIISIYTNILYKYQHKTNSGYYKYCKLAYRNLLASC